MPNATPMSGASGGAQVSLGQLSGDERKVLVARLVALANADAHLDLVARDASRSARRMRMHVLTSALSPLQRSDGRRLDQFLETWIERAHSVSQLTAQSGNGESDEAVDAFLNAIQVEVRALRCDACPGRAHELCVEEEPHRLARSGRCLGDLRAIFRYVGVLARRLYHDAGIEPDQVRRVRVSLATARSGAGGKRLLADVGASASCWYSDSGTGAGYRSTVLLELGLEDLELRTMRALPYVLLHELVAHAYQRLGCHERATSRDDPFAEGWMDFVARFVYVRSHHHRQMGDRRPLAQVRAVWLRDITPGLELCNARRDNRHHEAAPARLGFDVAERLLAVMAMLVGAGGERAFLQLSCGLNAEDLNDAERHELVGRLARALPRFGESVEHCDARALLLVEAFLTDGNISHFARGGVEL